MKKLHENFRVAVKFTVLIGFVMLVLATLPGCSTLDAVGGLFEGVGSDIRDMSQGSREEMSGRDRFYMNKAAREYNGR